MAIDAKVRHCCRYVTSSRRNVAFTGGRCALIDLNGSCAMKCTKRSFTVICIVLAVPLSYCPYRGFAAGADADAVGLVGCTCRRR